MYVMLHSRPDISVAVNYFSRCQSIATDAHFEQLKRILRYLKATLDLSIIYINKTMIQISYRVM